MRPESIVLFQALLDHHRLVCLREDGTSRPRRECVIAYGGLCSRAGVPHLTRYPGRFLQGALWGRRSLGSALFGRSLGALWGQTGALWGRRSLRRSLG